VTGFQKVGSVWVWGEWRIEPWAASWRLFLHGQKIGQYRRRDNAMRRAQDKTLGRARRS